MTELHSERETATKRQASLDGWRHSLDASLRHATTLLAGAAIVFFVVNWVLWLRSPQLAMPLGSILSLVFLASLHLLRGHAETPRQVRNRILGVHVLTGLSTAALIGTSIYVADFYPPEDAVAGLALIMLNATTAILVGLAFASLPRVGLQQIAIAGIPGAIKVLIDGDPDSIAFTVMFVAIVVMLSQMIGVANDDRLALIKTKRSLASALSAAEAGERAKSEFLANMSHEIRTPMNGVMGMAELLSRTALDARQKTFTDVILKSGNALLAIINDILDFSKIDAGKMTLDPAPFSLTDTVADVAALMAPAAAGKGIELIVRVAPSLPDSMVGDAGRIRQIVTNLVGNAVKFTESGHVYVDLDGQPGADGWEIAGKVTDTGIGIEPDKLNAIFDKFSQADGSASRKHEGTGLGLAIASRLVELMGGQIRVESTIGKGSCFSFSIRLAADPQSPAKAAPRKALARASVLVVDDNAVNRFILEEQMRGWGYEHAVVESGATALAFAKAASAMGKPVDAIVMDFQMPGMNGLDAARALRKISGFADVPVLFLSSVDDGNFADVIRQCAPAAWLVKPAKPADILGALADLVLVRSAPAPVAAPVRAKDDSPAQTGLTKVDILVAEDNEINQMVFSRVLDMTGLSYHIVNNGRQAVDFALASPPRLVIMDVSMPVLNGLDAAREIRTHAELNRIPIIGVTAHALKGDRERCLEAGMDDYITKPVSPDALKAKISDWLTRANLKAA